MQLEGRSLFYAAGTCPFVQLLKWTACRVAKWKEIAADGPSGSINLLKVKVGGKVLGSVSPKISPRNIVFNRTDGGWFPDTYAVPCMLDTCTQAMPKAIFPGLLGLG